MNLAIISNEFPPLMSSGSVQVRDLAIQFANEGHTVTVFTATYGQKKDIVCERFINFDVVRFSALRTKEINYFFRTINEILTPLIMLKHLKKTSISNSDWDGVIWYSPTIFLGPVANFLKKNSNCPGYLILRDIFPDWAVDMGLIGKGLPYKILKIFENYQYKVADIIGVQAYGNLKYFEKNTKNDATKIEVLNNWLSHSGEQKSSINISKTKLAGRKILIYAGNMGIAQGIEILFRLPILMQHRADIGFLFVGRGSEMEKYRNHAEYKNLDNIIFHDQINADEIPSLYKQCHIGMLSLDIRHKTHNIPGKFLSYIASGLPVLASVNPGNDLINLIEESQTGKVISDGNELNFFHQAENLLALTEQIDMKKNCLELSKDQFQPSRAVEQIKKSLLNYDLSKT